MPYQARKHVTTGSVYAVHRPPGDERQRNAEKARVYDADWKRLRMVMLARFPVCSCGKKATDVDHIQSWRSRPDLRLDPENLRTLCHSCHSKRTARDQGGWARKSDADRS